MDLKHLQTFRVIVEEGSFSKAAERLNYTQSTITFQIGQLEQALSVRLFEKIGRKMVLTKAGEQVVAYVDDVLRSVDRLQYFQGELADYQGTVRIGVAETLLCYRIPAVMKEFHKRAPKARLFLRSMNCYDIRDELIAGSLDIGVFYNCIGNDGGSLTMYPLGEYELSLVASPEIRHQYPNFVTPNQKIPIPFIINEPTCIFRQIFESYLREKSITLDHTIELWSVPTIKNLVKNNVGITYLPRFAVQEELNDGSLIEIPIDISDTAITAVCGYHKNKWVSPLMQVFVDICIEKLLHDEHG